MTANPILLQKKYSRVIECFAKQQGISDMHCMSDAYLAEELRQEYVLTSNVFTTQIQNP